jgi:hypothetical protein
MVKVNPLKVPIPFSQQNKKMANCCLPSLSFYKSQNVNSAPEFDRNNFSAPNIYVTASKSDKLTKDHLKVWFERVFFPMLAIKVFFYFIPGLHIMIKP